MAAYLTLVSCLEASSEPFIALWQCSFYNYCEFNLILAVLGYLRVFVMFPAAEINHFHSERVIDLKVAMQHFLKEQISFHERVSRY